MNISEKKIRIYTEKLKHDPAAPIHLSLMGNYLFNDTSINLRFPYSLDGKFVILCLN